jgi:hypothetical protein
MINHDCIWNDVDGFGREIGAKNSIFTSENHKNVQLPDEMMVASVCYPMCETQMAASTFRSIASRSLFVKMLAASSKPNRL